MNGMSPGGKEFPEQNFENAANARAYAYSGPSNSSIALKTGGVE
jgi:hypothetical protein